MRNKIIALSFLIVIMISIYIFHSIYVENHNPLLVKSNITVDNQIVSPQKLFDKNWQTIKNEYYDPTLNYQRWSHWKNHYHNKIKTYDDAKVAIDTIIASLNDPYSRFLTKEEFSKQNSTIASKICGIGVSIANNSGKIQIINVLEQTPAQYADLHTGDIITEVNGEKISGMSLAQVSNLVKGPENTPVNIEIVRNNKKILKQIIRKQISIKTVKSDNYEKIGYIQILSFISNSTPNEFLEALENTSDSKGLIIDLRGNTGGLLTNAIFIANLFINNGKLVSIVGRNGYRYDINAQETNININKPIILLIDGASASASEILSGAMKDYNKAKLLGTKTYGKGMVQKIISMPNSTGLNLTIARYLTPSGSDINKKGITPDIEINYTDKNDEKDTDIQLETAKNILNSMIN